MRITFNHASFSELDRTTKAIARAMQRLGSAKRIENASDDASGLAISNGLEAQTRGLSRAAKNVNEAMGLLSTAESSIGLQMEIVQRMRELAVQAANGTLSATERGSLNQELQQLFEEFDRIGKDAEFNGLHLLDGSLSTMNLQIGPSAKDQLQVTLQESTNKTIFIQPKTIGTGTFTRTATINTGVGGFYDEPQFDLNKDGILDFVPNNVTSTKIYLGTQTADFKLSTMLPGRLEGTPVDINEDGYLDLWHSSGVTQIAIYLGDASGAYTRMTTFDVGMNNSGNKRMQDFNGDNHLDLALWDATGTAKLFLGDGTGAFRESASFSMGALNTSGVRDWNADGYVDFFSGSTATGTYKLYLGNAEGNFTQTATVTLGANFNAVGYEDFNHDGCPDFMAEKNATRERVIVLGSGAGTLTVTATVAAGAGYIWSNSNYDWDFNGDNIWDFFAFHAATGTFKVWMGNGAGAYTQTTTLILGAGFDASFWGDDLNADGIKDFQTTNSASGTSVVITGNSAGAYSVTSTMSLGANYPYHWYYYDFNNDGRSDMMAQNATTNEYSFYLQNGGGAFILASTLGMGAGDWGDTPGDINGDGYPDFFIHTSTGDTKVYFGQGNGAFTQNSTVTWGAGMENLTWQDLNNDNVFDLINWDASGHVATFMNDGKGHFAETSRFTTTPISYFGVRDYNADGIADLQIMTSDNHYEVYLGSAAGVFSKTARLAYNPGDAFYEYDQDGDKIEDIFFLNWDNFSNARQQTTTQEKPAVLSILTQEQAQNSIEVLQKALENLAVRRANLGAIQSRLEVTERLAISTRDQLLEARSQIMDADFSEQMSELVRLQILQQAQNAALIHKNRNLHLLLELLAP